MIEVKIYHRKKLFIPFLDETATSFDEKNYDLVADITSDSSKKENGNPAFVPNPEIMFALSQNISESWTKVLMNSDVKRRSTSVGDVIQIDGINHLCDMIGFIEIPN